MEAKDGLFHDYRKLKEQAEPLTKIRENKEVSQKMLEGKYLERTEDQPMIIAVIKPSKR
jgi:hypothetical protein